MEVEAVDEGKIGQIVVPEGAEEVAVNAVIAILLEEGETAVPAGAAPAPAPAPPRRRRLPSPRPRLLLRRRPHLLPRHLHLRHQHLPRKRPRRSRQRRRGRPHLRLAARQAHRRREGASISRITGSGPERPHRQGRRRVRQAGCRAGRRCRCGAGAQGRTAVRRTAGVRRRRAIRACPHTAIRKVIARRMLESKQTVPHFYLTVDLEIDALLAARARRSTRWPRRRAPRSRSTTW